MCKPFFLRHNGQFYLAKNVPNFFLNIALKLLETAYMLG